jgi:hypothetical protein
MGEELTLDATPIDCGHDRTLVAQTLAKSPAERIARQASWSRGMKRIEDAARDPGS